MFAFAVIVNVLIAKAMPELSGWAVAALGMVFMGAQTAYVIFLLDHQKKSLSKS